MGPSDADSAVAKIRPDRFPVVKRKGAKLVQLLHTLRDLSTRLDDVVANQAAVTYTIARSVLTDFEQPCADDPLSSRVCRQVDCRKEYAEWQKKLGRPVAVDRKDWEWAAICRALSTAGVLQPGKRGLGFGVGSEPMVAAFAAKGVEIVATDLAVQDERTAQWVEHCLSLKGMEFPDICPNDVLAERVSVRAVDMNAIPDDLRGFDFVWSCCAFEHLGTIEAGLAFIEKSMQCLAPGGIAVHTTEYNLEPGDDTISEGGTVAFQARHFEDLARRLARSGHSMSPFTDGERGPGIYDYLIDVPPKHFGTLIVRLGKFRITPAIVVVRAAQ
jgi:hypothetical protein